MDVLIVRNALSLLALQGANLLLSLATLPYLTRVLGPTQFGAVALALAIVMYITVITDYGFNWSATKKIAEHRTSIAMVSEHYWNVMATKLLLAAACVIVLIACLFAIPALWRMRHILLATLPMILGTVLLPQWLFQGLERMGLVSICTIASRASVIPLIFWFVQSPSDAWKAALLSACSFLLSGLVACAIIRRYKLVRWCRPNLNGVQATLREGWHFFLSSSAISLFATTDSVLLGAISGPTAVGYFSAADRLKNAVLASIAPISNAVYPRINALMSADQERAFGMIRKLLKMQAVLTLAISLLLWTLADWLIKTIMGVEFAAAVPAFRWMAFLPFVIGMTNVCGVQTMLSLGMKRTFSRILIAFGFVNVAMLVPLAWMFGATGAAAAVFLTEFMVMVAMAVVLYRRHVPVLPFHGGSQR